MIYQYISYNSRLLNGKKIDGIGYSIVIDLRALALTFIYTNLTLCQIIQGRYQKKDVRGERGQARTKLLVFGRENTPQKKEVKIKSFSYVTLHFKASL